MNAAKNLQSKNQTQKSSPPRTPGIGISLPMRENLETRYPWQRTGFEPADGTKEKRRMTFEGGQGLLCGTTWGEQLDRELAAKGAREREYDERHQSLQRMLRSVVDVFSRSPYLNEKLFAAATAKMSPAVEATFQKYKQFCETWGLPFLHETVPQAITLFVLEFAANAREAKRIVKHIAEAYDKLNPRPWRDPLVCVMLETLKGEPAEKEEKELD